MDNIQTIEKLVQEIAEPDDWKYHIRLVVKNALLLADKLKADKKVVQIATLLHDIGRIKFGEENHNITGAEEADKILQDLDYSVDFIAKVKGCILKHRAKGDYIPETLEEQIIANADAMAHFDILPSYYFGYPNGLVFPDSYLDGKKKLLADWNNKLTLEVAKDLVRERFEAAQVLIKSVDEVLES